MERLSDEELMKSFCSTLNTSYLEVLINRYILFARGAAFHILKDYHLAEDAVQEAFLRIIEERNHYIPDMIFKPWFFKILKNICIDIIRKRKRMDDMESLRLVKYNYQDSTSSDDIDDILNILPEKEKEVLVLRIVYELSFREIAEILDCSIEAAKKRSQRGLRRLRSKISLFKVKYI